MTPMLRAVLLAPLAIACPPASPAPDAPSPSREQLLGAIDAAGRVVDRELRERTGWEVIRGFSWRIELEDARQPGRFAPADPQQSFHSGQRFRLQIEAFCDLFAYVVVANADGSEDVLLPLPGEPVPKLAKGQTLLLPPDGSAFRFQPPGGTHKLRLIASPVKLPWSDSRRLLGLRSGQEAPGGSQPSGEAARSVPQVKGLQTAVGRIDQGELARGCTVELVEPAPEGNLVTLTSADPGARPILAHEVPLNQAD